MFAVNSKTRIIHSVLIVMFLLGAAAPTTALAKPSDASEDMAVSSMDARTENLLAQTPEVLIQCVGSLSDCSDVNPNTALTEVIDFTNDDRRIEFKILCEGWSCSKRNIYYSVTMDVEWGNGIDAPWFHEYATLTTNPMGSGGFVNMPCGGGLSGSCSLSTSGVIAAEDISPNPDASWHFAIANTGGTSATYEWHHRVLNIQVSLDPIIDCSGTTLSPIAQAVQAVVSQDGPQAYCGNRYDNLITLPPGDDAFLKFRDLAEDAHYEVDFTTMLWNENGIHPGDSPGRIFLTGVKILYDKVQDPIANGLPSDYFSNGVRIRILIGLRTNPLELFENFGSSLPWQDQDIYQDQHARIKEDLDFLEIPLLDQNWNVEVALYKAPESWIDSTHSHVKLMIVDGNKVVTGGYNMQYAYLNGSSRRDMGVEVSGPIASHALKVFDDLWADAISCIEVNEDGDCTESTAVLHHHPALGTFIPEGNDVVFSLFRNDADKTADNAIAAAINAANGNVNVMQDRFMSNVWFPPQYARAILDVLQKEGTQVSVKLLVSGAPESMLISGTGICDLERKLAIEDPSKLQYFEARASNYPVHTKALSIDNSFIIVGSQNFDKSAWGNDPSKIDWGDLAEYSLGIENETAADTFNETFNDDWMYYSSPTGCYTFKGTNTLQSEIDQAEAGSSIILTEEGYAEPVTINKPLMLIGEGANQTIITPQGNQPAFRITSSDVTIMNMKISGGDGYGIELIDSSPSSLKNIQINRVVFENNAQGGVLAQGLIPGSPMNYAIENNTFIGGADGITINMVEMQAETSVIRDNIFSGQSNAPIHILSTDDSRVEYSYNLFDNCGLGACATNWVQGNISAVSNAHDNLFDLDPLFASPENGAYQLLANSPAIDAGDPELLHDLLFDGDNDGFIRIDMGAFEYAPIENVAPIVDAGNDQTVGLGESIILNATYSDADNTENHSARIDWGDGIIEDVPVNMTGPGTGDVTGEHSYSSPADYTVEVCVTDLYGAVGCDSILVTVNSSFPSTSVLDDFNRADGSIGGNWSGITFGYNIASNQLSVDYSGSNSDMYWSSEQFGADQEAYVTLTNVDTDAWEHNLLLKSQSNNTWGDGVIEVLYDPSGQRVQVWTYEWPAGWVQHGADIPVTFVDGDQFGARALADGTVEVYRNGELLAARDITSWSHFADGGYIGLWFIGAENAVLDDFGGGTVLSGMQSMSMDGTIESQDAETSLTPEQLNVTLTETGLFWQGFPIGSNQKASVTFAQLNKNVNAILKPQSNGVWGEGIVEVVYDMSGGRIQVWMYDAQKGWGQIGKDVPAKFTAGDTFTIHISADNMLEISRNGKVIAKRTLP